MPYIEESWDVIRLMVKLADKVADHAPALSYAGLLPDLIDAVTGIGEVPKELLDLDENEEKELYGRGEALARELNLGNEVLYEDVDDGMAIAVMLKGIILRHRQAKAAIAENAATAANEPK